jgi:hypothetical protein
MHVERLLHLLPPALEILMRARLLRPAAALALASAAALSLSASAATKPLVLTDPKGDANGVGVGPGSQDGKDVVSLTLAPLPGKACTGYTAVVELAAAPTANTSYRVLGTSAKNTAYLWVEYSNNPVSGTLSRLRWSDGTTGFVDLATPAKVDGSKITLTVLDKDLKAAGEKLANVKVEAPGVSVRTNSGAATAPEWDLMPGDKSFKVCS